MKTLPLYLAAVAALTACSSDEVVTPATTDDGADADISFTTAVSETTRAKVVTIDTLKESGFWVKALKADGISYPWGATGTLKFENTAGTNNFAPVVPEGSLFDAKWPKGQYMYFFASNLNQTDQSALSYCKYTNNYPPKVTFTPKTNVYEQTDFVYATNAGTSDNFTNGQVPLHFKHALVQIEIQAKNENPAYTVRVKGYRIHYLWCYATFKFPEPVTASTESTAPSGSWDTTSFGNAPTNNTTCVADYYSGFYNGYTTSGSGLSDTGTANYIQLGSDPVRISNGTSSGYAMVLPTGSANLSEFGFNNTSLGGPQDGFAIELLVQIDYNDASNTPLYPACQQGSMTKRISYKGLPKYYGYVYKPTTATFTTSYVGKKVIFLYDFTTSIGYVDNEVQGLRAQQSSIANEIATVDATSATYDANTGTDTAGAGGTDPYAFKDAVLGTAVGNITMTVSNWTDDPNNTSSNKLNL